MYHINLVGIHTITKLTFKMFKRILNSSLSNILMGLNFTINN